MESRKKIGFDRGKETKLPLGGLYKELLRSACYRTAAMDTSTDAVYVDCH